MLNEYVLQGILGVTGLFFLFTGVMSLLRPKDFANTLGLEPLGRSGEIEIRAQYGGFFTAAAISQFLAIGGLLSIQFAILLNLVIFGGLIVGRLLALLFRSEKQSLIPMIRNLFWIDAVGAAISIVCLWSN